MLNVSDVHLSATDVAAPSAEDGPLYRITVEQYHRLVADGALDDDAPVELLEGLLYEAIGKDPIHSAVNGIATESLRAICPPGWFVRNQEPVTTHDSEPEPDIAIVRGCIRDYLRRHPGPSETALLLEVANTSLARDRNLKMRIYAAAWCPLYWILNTTAREVEVYADPRPAGRLSRYADRRVYRIADHVPVVIDRRQIGAILVDDLIPALPSSPAE